MNASHNWLCMIFDSKLSFGDFAWLLTWIVGLFLLVSLIKKKKVQAKSLKCTNSM